MLIRFRGKAVAAISLYSFRCRYLYSTSAPTNLFARYLVDSLGFSVKEAASISSKVPSSWKSYKNPDLVLNYLKQTGLDKTQIKKIVSKSPKLLLYDFTKTLEPKMQCLVGLGLSGSDLVNVITKDTTIVERGLDTHLRPIIDCLRKTLGSDETVVKAIKRTPWLLSFSCHHTMETNLNLFRNCGFSDMVIKKLLLRNPRYIMQKPEWVKDLLHRVEKDFGVPLHSPIFLYGFHALASQKKTTLDGKIAVFKSFGWSDDAILEMFRKQPYCVAHSEDRIQRVLNFYMKELGFGTDYLASHPSILVYSLEKRVLPRMQVLKLLDEKKLLKRKVALYTVLSLADSKFIQNFVLPYKDQIPHLYQSHKSVA